MKHLDFGQLIGVDQRKRFIMNTLFPIIYKIDYISIDNMMDLFDK